MALVTTHKRGWSLALFACGIVALSLAPSFPALPFYVDQALQRVLLFALVALFVAALGGARALAPRLEGARSALRLGSYPVLLALGLFVLEATGIAALVAQEGTAALSGTWAVDLLGVAALCVGVGAFEEALFRVLLFGGLLSRHGHTKNGIVISGLVSSVVFGAVHVTASAGSFDPLTLAQMFLKTVQAGSLGMLLAAVYVRTRSFWGIAAIHALADLFVMAPLALLGGGEEALGSYVTPALTEEAGLGLVAIAVALVVVYVIAVALYLPAGMKGWRLLESADVPQLGPFVQGWDARDDAGPVGESAAADGRPVPPSGLDLK